MPNVPPPKKLRGRLTNWKETLRRGEIRGRISSVAGILGFVFHYSFCVIFSWIGKRRPAFIQRGATLFKTLSSPPVNGTDMHTGRFLHGAFSGLDAFEENEK